MKEYTTKIILFILIISNINVFSQQKDFTDDRDNKVYKTIQIGNTIWMAKNLAYKADTGCVPYKNNLSNIKDNGYLYTYDAALKACPDGWHLSSDKDWLSVEKYFGINEVDLNKEGRRGNEEFISNLFENLEITRNGWGIYERKFYDIGRVGAYWTSTKLKKDVAYCRFIKNEKYIYKLAKKNVLNYSVRCVKNNSASSE